MGASRIPSMVVMSFFSVAASEEWSPDANEIFLDLVLLRGDKGNVENRRRSGWVYGLVLYKHDFFT